MSTLVVDFRWPVLQEDYFYIKSPKIPGKCPNMTQNNYIKLSVQLTVIDPRLVWRVPNHRLQSKNKHKWSCHIFMRATAVCSCKLFFSEWKWHASFYVTLLHLFWAQGTVQKTNKQSKEASWEISFLMKMIREIRISMSRCSGLES